MMDSRGRGGDISPILASQSHQVYFTGRGHSRERRKGNFFVRQGQGDDTLNTDDNLTQCHSSTLLGRQRRARGFAVPRMEQFFTIRGDLSPGHVLNQNLRLLQIFLLNQIEELADSDTRDDKKGNGFDDSSAHYRFGLGCFMIPNTTEASCHALHLLAQCYDYKDAEALFRDCWPIDDKKMDGQFRRNVSIWMKKIIANHPQFFTDIKLEALGYLLVNPWGERFVQLMECFVELVLNLIIRGSALPDECAKLFNKPKYFANHSPVTSRQILTLTKQTGIFVQSTAKIRKKMLTDEVHSRRINEKVRTHIQSIDLAIENKSKRIEELQHSFPELHSNFNNNGLEEEVCTSYYFERLKELVNWDTESSINTNLQGMDGILTAQLKAFSNVAQSLETLFNKYNSVWYIIQLKTPKPRVLDIGSLYFTCTKPATLGDFINKIKEITRKFVDDERLKESVSTELLLNFKKLHLRFDHLKLCWKKLESKYLEITRKYVDCDLHLFLDVTKTSSEDSDWSDLSKFKIPPINGDLLFTPSTKIEFGATTGYTPRIMNFLEAKKMPSVFTPNSEEITITVTDSIPTKFQNNQENAQKSMTNKIGLLTPIMSPVTHFVANSQKPPLPVPNPRLSLTARTPSAKVKPNVDDENNGSSDFSISPDSPSPGRIDASAQARITKIMSSLSILSTPGSSANCSVAGGSLRVSDSFDGSKHGSSSRRSSLALRRRISTPFSDGGGAQPNGHNKSLLENWSGEKGIMDMSINSNGLWGSNESSEDES